VVDPQNLTNFDYTDDQLEEVALFAILAAGKNGEVSARSLDKLLAGIDAEGSPFDKIRSLDVDDLRARMKANGIGCQKVKGRGFKELADSGLNLRLCTCEALEEIHSISYKTSRLIVLHTRPDQEVVPLDTHNLAELRELGYDVPKSTPQGKKRYKTIEGWCVKLAKSLGMTVADWDLSVWKRRSNGKKKRSPRKKKLVAA